MRETVWFSENKHTVMEAGFVVLSLMVSVYLFFLPGYALLGLASPVWPVMTLFYWQKRWPGFANLWLFWLVGLCLDLVSSSIIGAQALALVLAYAVASLQREAKSNSRNLYTETLRLLLMVLVFQLVCFVVQESMGSLHFSILYFIPTLLSTLLWPWFRMLLQFFHRFFKRGW